MAVILSRALRVAWWGWLLATLAMIAGAVWVACTPGDPLIRVAGAQSATILIMTFPWNGRWER